MHQIRFRLWLRPDPARGALSAPLDPLAGFRGPTSKGREGWGGKTVIKKRGRGMKRSERERSGRKGAERRGKGGRRGGVQQEFSIILGSGYLRLGFIVNLSVQSVMYYVQAYVEGDRCSACQQGYFHLSESNPQGCQSCFCMGVTNQCTSSSYYRDQVGLKVLW